VLLDLGKCDAKAIRREFPNFIRICQQFLKLDPTSTPVPVKPRPAFMVGGIATDEQGQTSCPGIFAAGEVANCGFHGAGPLSGNTLLEALVMGSRAGDALGAFLKTEDKRKEKINVVKRVAREESIRLDEIFQGRGGEDPHLIQRELWEIMNETAGVLRNSRSLRKASRNIQKLQDRFLKNRAVPDVRRFNLERVSLIDLEGNLAVAQAIIAAAAAREETRGCHMMTDKKERNDTDWQQHSTVRQGAEGLEVGTEPVASDNNQPLERKY
jgi:succinate dehydrogenase/fumarate reductase flavoprotein subunit